MTNPNPNKSKIYNNPNALPAVLLTVALGASGVAGCSNSVKQVETRPICNQIKVGMPDRKKPRYVTFDLVASNDSRPNIYKVDHDLFDYGDGNKDDNKHGQREDHTYTRAGTFMVNAALVMDVLDSTKTGMADEAKIACPPATVTVK